MIAIAIAVGVFSGTLTFLAFVVWRAAQWSGDYDSNDKDDGE